MQTDTLLPACFDCGLFEETWRVTAFYTWRPKRRWERSFPFDGWPLQSCTHMSHTHTNIREKQNKMCSNMVTFCSLTVRLYWSWWCISDMLDLLDFIGFSYNSRTVFSYLSIYFYPGWNIWVNAKISHLSWFIVFVCVLFVSCEIEKGKKIVHLHQ